MKKKLAILAVLAACALVGSSVFAAVYTWEGDASGGSANDWNAQQNWLRVPNVNAPPTITDDAVFNTVATGDSVTPTIGTIGNIRIINFNPTATSFTIQGAGALTIGTGGIVDDAGVDQTFSVATINLGGSQSWNVNGSGNLLFTGTSVALGANNLTLGGDGDGSISIANVISGTGNLLKTGDNTLTLSGLNTYTGNTTLSGGIVNANSATAFGDPTGLTTVISLANTTVNLNANLYQVSGTPPSLALGEGAVINQNTSSSAFWNLAVNGDSVINLGASGELAFESATYSGGLLTINNWDGDAYDPNVLNPGGAAVGIFITDDPTASGLLANVQFTGPSGPYPQGAHWIAGTSELVPVPEPSTYAALFALGLLGFAIARRRMMAAA